MYIAYEACILARLYPNPFNLVFLKKKERKKMGSLMLV